ncbi:MAG: putative ABC transporter permease [Coprobacillus sp.]
MIIYFSIYTLFGFFMESIYISLFKKRWISSGLLKGPFIPLYGFGSIILIILSPYIKNSILITIIVGGISLTLLEYVSSLYIEKNFKQKCWDYSKHNFNYQGRICLIYSIIWSILSYLFIYHIHPFMSQLTTINTDALNVISLIYIFFIMKSYVTKICISKKNGLDIS